MRRPAEPHIAQLSLTYLLVFILQNLGQQQHLGYRQLVLQPLQVSGNNASIELSERLHLIFLIGFL